MEDTSPIKRRSTVGTVILLGWGIAGVLAMTIVIGVVFLSATNRPVPEVLSNWGGVIIGFYFGQFMSLIKDYMSARGEYEN